MKHIEHIVALLPPDAILGSKCTKNVFAAGRGSAPDPAGGAYSAPPDPLAVFEGPLHSRERERREGGEGRGGWEGRERDPCNFENRSTPMVRCLVKLASKTMAFVCVLSGGEGCHCQEL